MVKIKENIFEREFIYLNLFLKSAKDLVNEPGLERELTIKGGFSLLLIKRNIILTTYMFGHPPLRYMQF